MSTALRGDKQATKQIELALGGSDLWRLDLQSNELRTASHQTTFTTDKGIEKLPLTPCQTYKGFTDGDPAQSARLMITDNLIQGYIKRKGETWCIEPLTTFTGKASDNKYVLFKQSAIIAEAGLHCGVTEAQEQRYLQLHPTVNNPAAERSCLTKELELAVDADYEYFQTYGSNSSSNILSILNQVEGVYESTFRLRFRITYLNVWNTANDPYTLASSPGTVTELKNYWNNNMGFVSRDLVHLFSAKNYGSLYGSVGTDGIGSVCTSPSNAYGFTANRTGAFLTTAHEIGHNFSALHGDGQNCGSSNASIMCQGDKQLYFGSDETSRIGNYINSNGGCISPPQPSVTGPGVICTNNSATYTLQNAPAGTSVTWTAYGSLTPSSGTGSVATVTATNTADGNYVEFNLNGYCTATLRKDITIGIPTPYLQSPDIDGCYTFGGAFQILNYNPAFGYFVTANGSIRLSGTNPRNDGTIVVINNGRVGEGYVTVIVSNECGTAEPTAQSVYIPGCQYSKSVSAYPNPAQDRVTIPAEVEQIELVNQYGNVVVPQQLNPGQLDVTKLPDGLYVLRVTSAGKTKVQRLQVQH
jgi:Metallo-peptidase family M12/Secretion system C-terminal sorting domain